MHRRGLILSLISQPKHHSGLPVPLRLCWVGKTEVHKFLQKVVQMHKTFALHNGSGDTKSFSSGLLRNSVHSNHLLSIRLHFGFLALAVLASSLVLSGCGGLTSGSGGSSN